MVNSPEMIHPPNYEAMQPEPGHVFQLSESDITRFHLEGIPKVLEQLELARFETYGNDWPILRPLAPFAKLTSGHEQLAMQDTVLDVVQVLEQNADVVKRAIQKALHFDGGPPGPAPLCTCDGNKPGRMGQCATNGTKPEFVWPDGDPSYWWELPPADSFMVVGVDQQGNPVPAKWMELQQGGGAWACPDPDFNEYVLFTQYSQPDVSQESATTEAPTQTPVVIIIYVTPMPSTETPTPTPTDTLIPIPTRTPQPTLKPIGEYLKPENLINYGIVIVTPIGGLLAVVIVGNIINLNNHRRKK